MKPSFEALGAADIPFFSSRLVFFRFPGASLLSSSLCALDFVRSRLLLLSWCMLCNNRLSAQSSAENLLSSEKARLLLGVRIQVWHRLSAKFFFVRPRLLLLVLWCFTGYHLKEMHARHPSETAMFLKSHINCCTKLQILVIGFLKIL